MLVNRFSQIKFRVEEKVLTDTTVITFIFSVSTFVMKNICILEIRMYE